MLFEEPALEAGKFCLKNVSWMSPRKVAIVSQVFSRNLTYCQQANNPMYFFLIQLCESDSFIGVHFV